MLAGRYRIVAALGKGGMGEVYRADDLTLGQPVALKFLPQHLARDPTRLAYLHNEVRLARQVSHPNVCRVHDIGEADGQRFLSMEFVDGEDLTSLLRRIGRLPSDKAREIARQLCLGLAAAHDKGVLHCDLKPANVMLDGQGQVRITDFGLARLADQLGGEGNAGTPAYMAPEQLAGNPATERSDIYALGLLIYEIFTGKRARPQGQSVPAPPSVYVSDLDAAIEEVILRCLEKDPGNRPTSAFAVAAALTCSEPLVAGKTPSPLDHAEREQGLVFISYSRENEDLVLPLVSLLRASGQKVFISVQNLEYGADRKAQVAEAVRRSKRFLLFWSKSSQVSSFVGEECELALASPGCSVVPVLLDRTPLPLKVERLHGTGDLAPLFQTLRRTKLMRRLLWLSWVVLAVILAIVMPMMVLTLGPIEDSAFFLLNLVPWLVILVVPVLILWLLSLFRSHLLYRKVVKRLGV
jgi:serine/threonine protein kinase